MNRVAIFDFDNTLILGDSFLPFLSFAAGKSATAAAVTAALASYGWHRLQQKQTGSLRTFVKSVLLRHLLKGKKPENLIEAATKTRQWQKINAPIMQSLREHREKGDTILIASGSLDLYLPELLKGFPHDAVLCTDIGVENGIVTGEMTHGNCVRQTKAKRVGAWLTANGPFDESFGYGNYPHDVPMLNLVKHRIIVS